jgi:hypothetical protein
VLVGVPKEAHFRGFAKRFQCTPKVQWGQGIPRTGTVYYREGKSLGTRNTMEGFSYISQQAKGEMSVEQ